MPTTYLSTSSTRSPSVRRATRSPADADEVGSLTSTLTNTDASTILSETTPIRPSRVYLTRCWRNSCRVSRSVIVPTLSKDLSTAFQTVSFISAADTHWLPG